MIISHKHKFIFIRPTKVAGTSVELNLAKHCGKDDIITIIRQYSKEYDADFYSHTARNYTYFESHMTPEEIKSKVGSDIWNNYFKFTIVRNPWDHLVSRYLWRAHVESKNKQTWKAKLADWLKLRKSPIDFKSFIKNLHPNLTNTRFYFNPDGKPMADFHIRYENLEKDYRKVCDTLGIPYSRLPKTKSTLRKNRKHYSEYYDEESRKIVEEKCAKEIEKFKYRFEEAPT